MTDYEVIYEHYEAGHEPESWGAYVPDLPCTVAVAKTRAEVERLIHEAIDFHIECLRDEGLPVPPPGPAGASPRSGRPTGKRSDPRARGHAGSIRRKSGLEELR